MKHRIKQPYEIIQVDKHTGKINTPNLLLMNRCFDIIGKISKFENWNISLVGNGIDEISFDVHKYADGRLCPVWDDLIDLKIIEVSGFGMFEISVNYTDNTETIKSIHGISLEAELAQIGLYEFHINDEEAIDMAATDSSRDYDSEGNFIPTTFYNPNDEQHSLLHRVLADKASHWNIGYVTPFIALDEKSQPEESKKFQRTYTVNGESIYDFLTGTVAEESNVIFTFHVSRNETTGKPERLINCYNLCDCIDQKKGTVMCKGIGEDTTVFVSKNKLANEIAISSNKDNIKNCFRIEGGDDIITDMVRAVNMNGSNYIYQFADFQCQDMPKALVKTITEYNENFSKEKSNYYGSGDMDAFIHGSLALHVRSEQEAVTALSVCKDNRITINSTDPSDYADAPYWYIVSSENFKELHCSETKTMQSKPVTDAFHTMGIYSKLCIKYIELSYLESSMMPDVNIIETTAKEQYENMTEALKNMTVGVSSLNKYNNNLFIGVSNNVEAMANILIDARYKAEVIKDSASFQKNTDNEYIWTGNIKITRAADETDYYPKTDEQIRTCFNIKISDDELTFTRQKIEKALHEGSMLDIDFDVAGMDDTRIRSYFNKYSLNRLKSFYDGYNSCLSILMQLDTASTVRKDLYEKYFNRMRILSNPPTEENSDAVPGVLDIRQRQVDVIHSEITNIKTAQSEFQKEWNFKDYLDRKGKDFYKIFCSYRREDVYTNSNYVSDGLTSSECLAKAKELIEAATKEAKRACVLQRTVSTSLNNLFSLPEFEPFYDKFALYNYIRIRTEDEILKLRLIGIDFSGDSTEKIDVTFSEQIESVDGTSNDLQSILKQAKSMASSYPSTALQAKQGAAANSEITDMYHNGLNAAKTILFNNDKQEVTINEAGILCRRMNDEDIYDNKQLRITGNIIGFTKNNWHSVELAIGETFFEDPENPTGTEKKSAYGIVAENIVGKLMASEKVFIGNKSNNVLITGNGITIKNGLIQSANYEAGKTGSMLDLTNGTFDYAGGSLTYKDHTLSVKGDVTAERLIATGSGKIADFSFDNDKIYTGKGNFGNSDEIYFGKDGLSIGSKFKVSSAGDMEIQSSSIGGWNIGNDSLSCKKNSNEIYLNSETASVISKSGDNEAILSSGNLCFKKSDKKYATFHITEWADKPTVYGVGVNSDAESKFIAFGNKKEEKEDTYITPLVLNYGLNPDGNTQDVLLYGDTLVNGNLYFKSKAYLTDVTNGITCQGIFYADKIVLGGSTYGNHQLTVSGNSYMNGNLYVGNDLIAEGAYDHVGTDAPNLMIGGAYKIRKTTGSAKRFKELVKPVESKDLDPVKLYELEIMQYKFKNDYLSEDDQRYDKEVIGFIAEDVYEKYPIAADCSTDKDGNVIVNDWNFRYMIPAMLKLIQDQKKSIDQLKQENKDFKQRIDHLEKISLIP